LKILNSKYCLKDSLRAGIFIIGAVLLVLGIFLVADYSRMTILMESYAGGLAVLSEDYQIWRAYVILGQIITVTGIIIISVGIFVHLKSRIKGTSNLEILKERYAKGEITKEEFDKMKGDLS